MRKLPQLLSTFTKQFFSEDIILPLPGRMYYDVLFRLLNICCNNTTDFNQQLMLGVEQNSSRRNEKIHNSERYLKYEYTFKKVT